MTSLLSSRRARAGGIVAASLAAAALALTGCSTSTTTTDSGEKSFGDINVQLSWIKNAEFAGEFYALDNGYYTEQGFGAVTLTSGPSTGASELDTGKAQFALSDAASIASAISEGSTLKIVGATYQKNPFTLISLASSNIKTPKDLIGKKIGVDDSNTALFQGFLTANGLTASQVKIVPGHFDGPTQVESGTADAYVAYITNEAIAVHNDFVAGKIKSDVSRMDFADNGLPFVAETITTTQEMIDDHPDLVKAFLIAEIKGWAATFKASGEDVVAKVIQHFNAAVALPGSSEKSNSAGSLDKAETLGEFTGQKDLVASADTKANGLFTISAALKASTMKSVQTMGFKVTAEQLFDTSFIDAIYKDSPDLKNYGG